MIDYISMFINKMKQTQVEIFFKILSHCEISLWTALSQKWLAQRTQVRFRHHFRDALPTTKFLGE